MDLHCFQSPWFQCIIIESSIVQWLVLRGGQSCMFLKEVGQDIKKGGLKKKCGGGGGRGADRPFRSMSKNYTKLVLKPLNKNY